MDKKLSFPRFRKSNILLLALLVIITYIFIHKHRSQYPQFQAQSSDTEFFNHEYKSILQTVSEDKVVTNIKIKKCLKYSSCQLSKVEQSAGWVRISPALELYPSSQGIRSLELFKHYVFIHSLPVERVETGLENLMITNSHEKPQFDTTGWDHEKFDDLMVWKKSINKSNPKFRSTPVIRDVNILFGLKNVGDKREYWELQMNPIEIDCDVSPHISLLKIAIDQKEKIIKQQQQFQYLKDNQILISKSKLKILQISDLHAGPSISVDDYKTLQLIAKIIDSENEKSVDLVVITGDLIDSYRTKEFKSTLLKVLSPILERKIPFIFTFGESDEISSKKEELKSGKTYTSSAAEKEEDDEIRNNQVVPVDHQLKLQILNFLSTLPNCYNKYIDKSTSKKLRNNNMHGLTNYNLKVFASDINPNANANLDLNKPNALVSILDSENHKIDASQINYLFRENTKIDTENPFKLLFFHYPLPNYRPEGEFKIIGSYNTKSPLKKNTDAKFRDDIIDLGYHVVSVGHEHDNDACILSEKSDNDKGKNSRDSIWLCYNSVTGYGAETNTADDYERKARLFEINFDNMQLLSWKRTEKGAFEYQMVHHY